MQRYSKRDRGCQAPILALCLVAAAAQGCDDQDAEDRDAAMGPGGAGAGATAGGAQGGTSGVGSPPTIPTCDTHPELVPDAGGDDCLACIIENCCDMALSCILRGNNCYQPMFAAINECFESEVADASVRESWYIVAECNDALYASDEWHDAGGVLVQVGSFPFNSPGNAIVECAVGSRPASAPAQAEVGVGGRKLKATRNSVPESCAEECIRGWR
jgi:hypothetical protein